VFGAIQRGGDLRIFMLENVQRVNVEPLIRANIKSGSTVYTDEYVIYSNLEGSGYAHRAVNHGSGEYARDEDGDGFHEVHVNTIEGVWSLLRSWLRPHRGISQGNLPSFLKFFEVLHNVRRRGRMLLDALLKRLLFQAPASQ